MPIIFDASVFDQTGPDPDQEMANAIGSFAAGIGQGLKEGMDFERQKQADKDKMEFEAKLSREKAAFEQEFQAREADKNRAQAQSQFNMTFGIEENKANAAIAADEATRTLREKEAQALEEEKKRLEVERKKQEELKKAQSEWRSQYGGLVPSPVQPSWVSEGTYSQEQYTEIQKRRDAFMKGYTSPEGTFVPPSAHDIATFDDGIERQYRLDREARQNERAANGMRTFLNRSLFNGPQGAERKAQMQPYVDAVQNGQMTPFEAHQIMEEQYRDFEETDYVIRQSQMNADRISIQRKELEELDTKHGADPTFKAWLTERRRKLDEASAINTRAQTREDFNGVGDLLDSRGSSAVTKVMPDGTTQAKPSEKESYNFVKDVQSSLQATSQFSSMSDEDLSILGASSPVDGFTPLERGKQIRDGIVARTWASLVPPSGSSRANADEARANVDAALGGEETLPPAAAPATPAAPAPAAPTPTAPKPEGSPAERAMRESAATSKATPDQRKAAEDLVKGSAVKVEEQKAAVGKAGSLADQTASAMKAATSGYSQPSSLSGFANLEGIKVQLAKAQTAKDLQKVLAEATKQFDALKELRGKIDSRMKPTPGDAPAESDVNDYKLIESVMNPLGELINALDSAIEMGVEPKDLGL